MERTTTSLKVSKDQKEDPVEQVIEKLQEENKRLRAMVMQLTSIIARNVLGRKDEP